MGERVREEDSGGIKMNVSIWLIGNMADSTDDWMRAWCHLHPELREKGRGFKSQTLADFRVYYHDTRVP